MNPFDKIKQLTMGENYTPEEIKAKLLGDLDRLHPYNPEQPFEDQLQAVNSYISQFEKLDAEWKKQAQREAIEKLTRDKQLHDMRYRDAGTEVDQRTQLPLDPDGKPVTSDSDDIKDRMASKESERKNSEDPNRPWGGGPTGYGGVGSPKRRTPLASLKRGAGILQSIAEVDKKGMPIKPAKGKPYEDESGKIRTFSKISDGYSTGKPFYFEFIHLDTETNQQLVLWGTAPGSESPGNISIPLKVKYIIPRDQEHMYSLTGKDNKTQYVEPGESQTNTINEQIDTIKKLMYGESTPGVKEYEPGVYKISGGSSEYDPARDPKIQEILSRWREEEEISKEIRIGKKYGTLAKKDPGDDSSMWKLYRKAPVDFRPIFHKLTKKFPDLDLYLPYGPDGSLPPAAAGAAANDMGVNQNQNMEGHLKAMEKYWSKQLGQSQDALKDALDELRKQGGASVSQPPIIINNPPPVEFPIRSPHPKERDEEDEEDEKDKEEIKSPLDLDRTDTPSKTPDIKSPIDLEPNPLEINPKTGKPYKGTPEQREKWRKSKQKQKEREIADAEKREDAKQRKRRQRSRDKAKKDGIELFDTHPDAKRKPGRKPKKGKENKEKSDNNKPGTIVKIKDKEKENPDPKGDKKIAEALSRIKKLTTGNNT